MQKNKLFEIKHLAKSFDKLVVLSDIDFDVEQGGQVEIIGWLYQYYNTEPKASVDKKVKNGGKVAGKHRAEEDPGGEDEGGILRPQGKHDPDGDDVCKTQLHAGDGYDWGNLGFNDKNG